MVDRNSVPEEFARFWQSKRIGIITIETEKMWIRFSCDVFVAVGCRGLLTSLIFTKAWSMQAWIPVVSSSLYFWKSVFSFRVDSILKWRVYIKQKVSWLHAFLWCMSQTSRDRDNSRRVRTHEKNSGETVRRLGTIIQSIFCAQSGASIHLTVWKWSGESRYPGAFPLCLKTFVAPFLPAQLIAQEEQTRSILFLDYKELYASWLSLMCVAQSARASGRLCKISKGYHSY